MMRTNMYRDSNINKVKVRRPGGRDEWPMMMAPPQHSAPMCAAPIVGFPRSAFEAVHDDSMKFRQLPCRTHISVGVCPYREKCVFLHDPRCCSATAKSITRLKNKNKDDCIADSLYWPAMPRSMVMQYPDGEKRPKNPYHPYDDHEAEQQPHSVQPYCVPVPQADQYHLHDAAVYSMWMHFVDFCLANAAPCNHPDTAMCYAAVDVAVNPYARSKRLSVFRALCNGQHVPYPGARYPTAPAAQRDVSRDPEYTSVRAPLPEALRAPKPAAPIGSFAAAAPSASIFSGMSGSGVSALHASPASGASNAPPSAPSTSPMVLTRRNSAGSPVSVTDHLLPVEDVLDLSDEAVEPFGGEVCGVSSLRRENLPRTMVSPLLMPSLF